MLIQLEIVENIKLEARVVKLFCDIGYRNSKHQFEANKCSNYSSREVSKLLARSIFDSTSTSNHN